MHRWPFAAALLLAPGCFSPPDNASPGDTDDVPLTSSSGVPDPSAGTDGGTDSGGSTDPMDGTGESGGTTGSPDPDTDTTGDGGSTTDDGTTGGCAGVFDHSNYGKACFQ